VPNSQRIKERILKENHEPVNIEYLGQQQMIELIKRNYWWPGIKNNVKKYIQGCFKCQQNKVQHMKKARELYPLKTPKDSWKEISINIIGPLLEFNGKDMIIVIDCGPIYKDDLTQSDNDKCVIREDCKDLPR